jgi:di/tricarboxylate transporter
LVAFSALIISVIIGVVPYERAFDGFGHPATIIVALVLIVSKGLVNSGAIYFVGRKISEFGGTIWQHISVIGFVGAILSAFMNNVAALALLMPIDINKARESKWTPRATLMPLSFATILGGMATMIGTPPNIIISGIKYKYSGEPFKMFDFLPVGGLTAIVGLIFVSFIGWRLLPKSNEGNDAAKELTDISTFVSNLEISKASLVIGKKLSEIYSEADKYDVAILGIVRNELRIDKGSSNIILQEKDQLLIDATPEELDEFRSLLKLEFPFEREKISAESDDFIPLEVVVTDESRLVNSTASKIGLGWRKNTVLLGISRRGRPIRKQIRKTIIKSGDILLILVPKESYHEVLNWINCLPLADRGLNLTDTSKMGIALTIFFSGLILTSLGLVKLPIILGAVVILYCLSKIIPVRDVYNSVEWPVIVLLASIIPLGSALEGNGTTMIIVELLTDLSMDLKPWLIITLLMVLTMTLSDILNNTATTIVIAPIGIKLAENLNMNPDTFLMAIAISASCAFLTPIGHKNNTIILGPGGYKFGDYWKVGLPLEIIIILVSVPLLLFFWPL